MEAREERGMLIAATQRLTNQSAGIWTVPSQSRVGAFYIVNVGGTAPTCSCPDYDTHHGKCKHIFAVEFTTRRETHPDGTITETQTVRVTYGQNWAAYNAAQTNEKASVAVLLRELCTGIESPKQGRGRPRLPLSDITFSAVMKVFTTFSGRRATTDIRECEAKGQIEAAPHYNSIFNYLGNETLTPILKALVEQSAAPLKSVETDFAVDSTGFGTCGFERWFDERYGQLRSKHEWLKVHVMTGVKTNVITSVEVTERSVGDAPQLPGLLKRTARNFNVSEVSADKGYSSKDNMERITDAGATPFIAFKTGSVADNGSEVWRKMFYYFQFRREDFLGHYHKRSNVESTFSMLKRKFGSSVRSKTPTAQVNELLCKVLCHNLSVLVHAIHELGIAPIFWAESPAAQKNQIGW